MWGIVYLKQKIISLKERYNDKRTLGKINEIVKSSGLKARYVGHFRSVGVTGDARAYSRIVCLYGERMPQHVILEELSRKISNETPVTRVVVEIARKI